MRVSGLVGPCSWRALLRATARCALHGFGFEGIRMLEAGSCLEYMGVGVKCVVSVFALLAFRVEVMAQRGARGYTNSIVRGEIIGSVEVEVLWKRKPRASSLIKKEC